MIQQGNELETLDPTRREDGDRETTVTLTDVVVLVLLLAGIGYGTAYYFGYVNPFGAASEKLADSNSEEDFSDTILNDFTLPDMKRLHQSGQGQISSQYGTVKKLTGQFNEDRSNRESRIECGEAWGKLGQLLHLGQFPEPAATCYSNAAALLPDDFRWFYLHARLLFKDNPQEAEELFDQARIDLEADEDSQAQQLVALWYWVGMLARNDSNFDKARSAFRKAIGYNQNAFAVWMALGQTELEAGNAAAALKALNTTQRLLPAKHKSVVAYSLGLAYRANKQEKLAAAYLKKGGKKSQGLSVSDPLWNQTQELLRTPNALSQRAIRQLDRGNLIQAESLLREAVQLKPDDSGLHNNLAGLLMMKNQLDEAKESFAKAVELNPQLISAHRGLAAIASKASDFKTAKKHLDIAYGVAPKDRKVLIDLGRLQYKQKNYSKALEYFESVLKLDPGNPDATLGRELAVSSMKASGK